MVEIYNEAVHDLLDENDHRREMELQSCKGGFTVPGLTESAVESPEQIFEIMEAGFEHRAVGCHDVNAHSSRSHCLLIVNVNVSHTHRLCSSVAVLRVISAAVISLFANLCLMYREPTCPPA